LLMPKGKFSEAETAPYRARALAGVERAKYFAAVTKDALEHYATHCEACARGKGMLPETITHFMERARTARALAKGCA